MKIAEVASAEDQLALWRVISDNTWRAIATQAEQERRAKAERAARSKSQPRKRGVRRSSPKAVATPVLKPIDPNPQPAAKTPASAKAQTTAEPTITPPPDKPAGPFGAPGVIAAPVLNTQPTALSAAAPQSSKLPATALGQPPKMPATRVKPHLSARAGGFTV